MTVIIKKLLQLSLSIFSIFILVGCVGINRQVPEISQTSLTSYHITHIVRGQTIPVYIDNSFNSRNRTQLIVNSIRRWQRTLGNEIKIEIVNTNFDMDASVLEKAQREKIWFILNKHDTNPNNPTADNSPDQHCKLRAWTDDFEGYIINVIEENVPNEFLETTINHEIGHLLNLEHSNNKSSLMYKHELLNNYKCIDRKSLDTIITFYNLDASKIKYDC